jgi:hypothetical protein
MCYGNQLTDTCIKNGGDHFLQEIAGKDFVGEMIALIKAPVNFPVQRGCHARPAVLKVFLHLSGNYPSSTRYGSMLVPAVGSGF